MSRWTRILPAVVAIGLVGSVFAARDVESPKAKTAKPATVAVQKGPFRVELSLKGVFESPAMQEVSVHLEAWNPLIGPLTVVSAAEPGATVRKGDVLIKLDPDRITKAIRDLKSDQHLADIGPKQLELDVQALAQSTPLDLTAAERSRKIADEDWKRFNRSRRPSPKSR